jgi:3-hydroxyisobutyrate dehydrogenase
MSIKNITVIGLGNMGSAIATLLLKASYRVTGYDIVGKKVSGLVPLGLKPARSPKEASRRADLVILSLRTWEIIKTVVEGTNGILDAAKPGQIIADMSTVPPWETKSMAERLSKKGIDWMDVPISGSAAQARVGNMVFMAGGKRSIFSKIKPVLDSIGKKTVYVGKNGDAAMLKIVVNTILFLNQASAIEGFVLGLKADLDPDVMYEVISSGAAGSNLIDARGRDMLAGDFKLKGGLGLKDVGLTLESAERLQVMLPMSALYRQLMLQAYYSGLFGQDGTVVMRVYEQLAAIKRKYKEPFKS